MDIPPDYYVDGPPQEYNSEPHKVEGRKPPSAVEIERAILGALLIEREAVYKVMSLLKVDAFYLGQHRVIYEAMINLFNRNEVCDLITVSEELKKMGKLSEAGGAIYVSRLSEEVSTAANVEYHAKIVIEKSILRGLINVATDIASTSYTGNQDAFDVLEWAGKKMYEITESHIQRTFKNMPTAVNEAMELIAAIHSTDLTKLATPSGFYELDDLLGGFQKSDMVVLAARPSMGKTALALSFATNAAMHKVPVAVFSLEMATVQLVMRLICSEGKLDASLVRSGKLPAAESAKLPKFASKLINLPIYIDDAPAQSILEIRAKSRRLKSEHNIGMIVIDYLQLVHGPQGMDSREREISFISRSLKALAKELNIPVIALSQLNREAEKRVDKRPQLSDLRESGSIEQDADVVMFIHRPEYYGIKSDPSTGASTEGLAEIIIAKHRNGPTGSARIRFIKEYTRFENGDFYVNDASSITPVKEDYL